MSQTLETILLWILATVIGVVCGSLAFIVFYL